MVKARPELTNHFHIWGGDKLIDFLNQYRDVSDAYFDAISAGHVLSTIYKHLGEQSAQVQQLLRVLIVTQFHEHQCTKLEQAGSTADTRPGIHRLFADIPFLAPLYKYSAMAATELSKTLAAAHNIDVISNAHSNWKDWEQLPSRSRAWFIKGGPGQAKSTLAQYVCQIQRAALILDTDGPVVLPNVRALAQEVRVAAEKLDLWPIAPRIPVVVDLKEFAFWAGSQREQHSRRVLFFLTEFMAKQTGEDVKAGTLRHAFENGRWLFVFDGLDEVPGDVKHVVAD